MDPENLSGENAG